MKVSEFRALIREEVKNVIKENTIHNRRKKLVKEENNSTELILIHTAEDTSLNNWDDYEGLVREYPIFKKIDRNWAQKYLTSPYLDGIRTYKVNSLENALVKKFKAAGVPVEIGEGSDTMIALELSK